MDPSLTDTLCTRCGLCCDGSLFADVELVGPSEVTRLQSMGLEIEEDDADRELLSQPCCALRGKLCSVYAHRPNVCRTFECRLLRNVRRGAVDEARARVLVSEALRRVARVRELIARLNRQRERLPLREACAEALARNDAADPVTNRRRARLAAEMSALEGLLRRTFLPAR